MKLSQDERQFVARMEETQQETFSGEVIVKKGAPSTHVHVLKWGWAIARSRRLHGRSQILRVYLPGELIGLGELGPGLAPHQVTMQTDGAICPFPTTHLADLYNDHPRLAALLTGISSLEQIAMREQCFALSRMTAEDRLVHFLLMLRDRLQVANMGLGTRFQLPFSQAELGDILGLTPVYINKLLRRLVLAERIAVERPYIRLLDLDGMVEQVEFRSLFSDLDKSWFPDPSAAPAEARSKAS